MGQATTAELDEILARGAFEKSSKPDRDRAQEDFLFS